MATSDTNLPNRRRKKTRFYRKWKFWLGFLLVVLVLAAIGATMLDRYTRPYRERAETYDLRQIGKVEEPSLILGHDGAEIGRIFVQNRSVIDISEVPQNFIDALQAGEDKRFFKHGGVDIVGILRAAIDWWRVGSAVSGASTITQQLARGAFDLEEERARRGETGIERKIVEAFLARRIEKTHTKQQILEFYLNRIYFGSGYYGLRSASLGYFGKEPRELSKLECATIVGLIKNPTGLSPLNNKQASTVARNMVLERMINLKMLSFAEGSRLRMEPITLHPKPLRRGTTHLYERIADEIRSLFGENALARGGYEIRTSIDSRVQKAAEQTLEKMLRQAEDNPGYDNPKRGTGEATHWLQGAVLMEDYRTGAVIAYVGGRDYEKVPFDMIEQGHQPMGTSFQPFVYAAALEAGMTPVTMVDDDRMDNRTVMVGGREGILGEWGMETTRPRYEGKITLRRALETSKVAAGVRVATDTGLSKVIATANAFGLNFKEVEALPRLAVGWETASLREVVRAYSAFARGGHLGSKNLWYVQSIRDSEGGTVYQREMARDMEPAAVSEATAYQIHNILQDGMSHGSAAGVLDELLETPFNGACKTGTTHNFSDNWFLGYNGQVACGVWIGYLSAGKTIYEGAFSRDLAMPVWAAAMNAAATDFGGRGIPQPSSVVQETVCSVSGGLVTPYCYEMVQNPATGEMQSRPSGITEYFRKGTEKLPYCPVHSGSTLAEEGDSRGLMDMAHMVVIDASPVRPKGILLSGDDPYHSINGFTDEGKVRPVRGPRTNVLDSFDVEADALKIDLPKAERLEISPE